MPLERARELIAARLAFGSGYNRNSAPPISGQDPSCARAVGVGPLIRELDPEPLFGRKPGTDFSKVTR
jgi:hypothetical protein